MTFKAEVTRYDSGLNGNDVSDEREFDTLESAEAWVKNARHYYSRAWINNREVDIETCKPRYMTEFDVMAQVNQQITSIFANSTVNTGGFGNDVTEAKE